MVEAHYQLPSISYLPILLPIPYCRVLQGMVCMRTVVVDPRDDSY